MTDQSAKTVKQWRYPFVAPDGKTIDDPQAVYDALSAADDGFYPLGINGLWHGGVHFSANTASKMGQNQGVRCIADGEVVAYRIDKTYPKDKFSTGYALCSTGFTLIRHKLELPPAPSTAPVPTPTAPTAANPPAPTQAPAPATPPPSTPAHGPTPAATPPPQPSLTFFSLYMHQLDWKGYQHNAEFRTPHFWTKKSNIFRVGDRATDPQTTTLEPSGAQWVARFPTSNVTSSLSEPFRTAVNNFIKAIRQAGGTVRISATLRPKERAYLMHYSWRIAKEGLAPESVPAQAGVNIDWAHLGPTGAADHAASVSAASAMVNGYQIAYEPSLTSRHITGNAIDMTISNIVGKTMTNAYGASVKINSESKLYDVGAGYGVHKLESDPPHWSNNGH
jgi:D-alanyl-D-alanine dipeptidase